MKNLRTSESVLQPLDWVGIVVLVGLIGWFALYGNGGDTEENLFSKRMECAKLESAVKEKLVEIQRPIYSKNVGGSLIADYENNVLRKLFYSPSLDTCLYAYVTEDAVNYSLHASQDYSDDYDPERVPVTRDLYIIADALTHETIFVGAKGDMWATDFDAKIAEFQRQ